jgi:hypothetical protein
MANHAPTESDLLAILRDAGPLTGKELLAKSGASDLALWRACARSEAIGQSRVGERYLRLDKAVAAVGRLSPSIKREFLTYTVLSTAEHAEAREARAKAMRDGFFKISVEKRALARARIAEVFAALSDPERAAAEVTVVIAGDVVYGMAHREPRPESSRGKMVNGSDLDLILVTADGFPDALRDELDQAVHVEKYRLLIHPAHREEIDYILKDMARVRAQLAFDDFKHMVASKILAEGEYLHGSRPLFDEIKRLVAETGVGAKLDALADEAAADRAEAERELLVEKDGLAESECWKLFYTQAEQDEIF